MTIDLRSDTVTKPTPEMLEVMMSAKVGDDVYKEDPTVNELEEKIAHMFGKEKALFFPTGSRPFFLQPSWHLCSRACTI